MHKILVVGGGVTSAVLTSVLSKLNGIQVSVWDKGRGPGGRATSSRHPQNADVKIDIGAQYLTVTPDLHSRYNFIYDALLEKGIIEPLNKKIRNARPHSVPGTRDYVAKEGTSSIVKYFFKESEISPIFSRKLAGIRPSSTSQGKWKLLTDHNDEEEFDQVILTLPVTQFFQLNQDLNNYDANVLKELHKIDYSARYVLGLFFDESVKSLKGFEDPDICGEYIYDDDIMRYLSLENRKRNNDSQSISAVFHTNVQFGEKYKESTPDEMKSILEDKVKSLYPDWPSYHSVKCHKWKYSQVIKKSQSLVDSGFAQISPGLILCGDAFAEPSNINGCFISAIKTSEFVKTHLK